MLQILPLTTQGFMIDGDYQKVTSVNDIFYSVYNKGFDGPFSSPTVLINDSTTNSRLVLNENQRTGVFNSIFKP